MRYSLAFSPCPNDTFIFDALVNKKMDTAGLEFDVRLEDVQTLNRLALANTINFSKVSYGVWPLLQQTHHLLKSGGALGIGVGPLLISTKVKLDKKVEDCTIAIPGENTTAHFLFKLAYPTATKKVFKVFHEIEDAVLTGEVDAGVIIHENRFTYEAKGLHKLIDLGAYWEEKLQMPIPLGGIVAQKNIPIEVVMQVEQFIQKSIAYAWAQYPTLSDYVWMHSQEMSEDVMRKHINLYVNDYSIDIGDDGAKAVSKLVDVSRSISSESMIVRSSERLSILRPDDLTT